MTRVRERGLRGGRLVRVSFVLVVALCVATIGCATPECWYGYTEREWYPDIDEPFTPLSSLVGGWQLFTGHGRTVGAPDRVFRVLFAVHVERREVRLVRDYADLRGLVEIRTPAQALEFVRLVTDYETFHLFWDKDDYLGDRSASEIDAFLEDAFEVIEETTDERDWGSLPASTYRRLGMHRPIVFRRGGDYVILRCLAKEVNTPLTRGADVYWVEEHLQTDGSYRLVSKTVAGTGLDIMFPIIF